MMDERDRIDDYIERLEGAIQGALSLLEQDGWSEGPVLDTLRAAIAGQGQGLKQRALESLASCYIGDNPDYVTISVDLVLMARGETPREYPTGERGS